MNGRPVSRIVKSLTSLMEAEIGKAEGWVVVFGPGRAKAHYRLRESIKHRIEACSRASVLGVFPEELPEALEEAMGRAPNFVVWEESLMRLPEVVLGVILLAEGSSGPTSELTSLLERKICARKLLILLPEAVSKGGGYFVEGPVKFSDQVFRNVRIFDDYEEARSCCEEFYLANEEWWRKYKTWPLVEETNEELIKLIA